MGKRRRRKKRSPRGSGDTVETCGSCGADDASLFADDGSRLCSACFQLRAHQATETRADKWLLGSGGFLVVVGLLISPLLKYLSYPFLGEWSTAGFGAKMAARGMFYGTLAMLAVGSLPILTFGVGVRRLVLWNRRQMNKPLE